MKQKAILFSVLAFLASVPLPALGELTLRMGREQGWTAVGALDGVAEIEAQRPWTVLALNAAVEPRDLAVDMLISFDEDDPAVFADAAGHYRVGNGDSTVAASQTGRIKARFGAGAALFSTRGNAADAGNLTVVPQSPFALFAAGRRVADFSIEFWAQPFNVDSGERMFGWNAVKRDGGAYIPQNISCVSSKNRFSWTFTNFFSSARGDSRTSVSLEGVTPLIPKTWSHHLIRFDSRTGLLEYYVNGKPEAITYTTSTGHEEGDVYIPLIGENGVFTLGAQFVGMLDELRVYNGLVMTDGNGARAKFPPAGGRVETKPLDLGQPNTSVVKVDAMTGRLSFAGNRLHNEFAGTSAVRFADESALQFFIRASESPYRFPNEWQPFSPGEPLANGVKGRYVQLAVRFYPSGDGEASPYLDEVCIVYKPDEPPLPPTRLTAIARDGAVDLSWKAGPDLDTAGYFVYYGTASGTYFGEGSILGASPIDVGKRTAIRIDGLTNGTLYYFAVAPYDAAKQEETPHLGAFSREISARPLPGMR